MTKEEIKEHMDVIKDMSHSTMAHLWRFAPLGHIYFDRGYPFFEAFNKRFKKLGGMTSQVSKQID